MDVAPAQVGICDGESAREHDERELIERARHDRRAFAAIYRQHYPTLLRYVYRRIGDVHATEDLVADVFLNAMRTLPRYRYRGVPIRFWFFRIATNAVNRWARGRRRRFAIELEADQLTVGDSTEQSTPGEIEPERARRALLTLSPKYQAVLALHYFEGLGLAEVATIIGCRVGTVKSRLARARDALRKTLTDGRQSRAQST